MTRVAYADRLLGSIEKKAARNYHGLLAKHSTPNDHVAPASPMKEGVLSVWDR